MDQERSEVGLKMNLGNKLTTKQKKNLASVIYYPEQKMDLMEEELPKNELLEWQHDTMVRLVHVARSVEISIQDQK